MADYQVQSGFQKKKIAIIHDALCVSGGAERIALWMAKAYPEAPIFTSVYLKDQTFPEFKNLDIRILPFANFIKSERQFKLFFPLWLMELHRLKFSEYDIVLSSSTYLAKYIQPTKGVSHKAYIHAPFRLLWKPESYTPDSLPTPKIVAMLVKATMPYFREWDKRITKMIPKIATNSQNMAREISRIYQKPSIIINPPVSINDYPVADTPGEYFLTVSRLISHKRIDLAIKACNLLKKELIVVGDGPERSKLEQISGDTIHFLGRVSENELKNLYLNSQALLFPSNEDYGIVPLEAQACGRPVIAFGKGGVLETVKEGETGIFFDEQNVDSLMKCMAKFQKMKFGPNQIREWASQFDVHNFISALHSFVSTD
jgi:glycosyltransferase involved in cell wall biosynthesis